MKKQHYEQTEAMKRDLINLFVRHQVLPELVERGRLRAKAHQQLQDTIGEQPVGHAPEMDAGRRPHAHWWHFGRWAS